MAKKRMRWTARKASAMLEEYEASGLSMAEFSRERGLHPERLRRWRSRLGSQSAPTGPRLVELVTTAEASRARVQVHCPSGHRVEVAGVELDVALRAALAAVAELPPSITASAC